MANDAAKKAMLRRKNTQLLWGGIMVAMNTVFISKKYFVDGQLYVGGSELFYFFVLAACYYFGFTGKVIGAENGDSSDLSTDLFGVAVIVQVLKLFTSSTWPYILLLLAPAALIYHSWSLFGPYISMFFSPNKATRDAAAEAAASKREAKRDRQMKQGKRVIYKN